VLYSAVPGVVSWVNWSAVSCLDLPGVPMSSQLQYSSPVGAQVCHIRPISAPERYWLIASLIIFWRLLIWSVPQPKSAFQ